MPAPRARSRPVPHLCATLSNPALPPLEFALQRRNRSNRTLQRVNVLVVVVARHRRGFVADD